MFVVSLAQETQGTKENLQEGEDPHDPLQSIAKRHDLGLRSGQADGLLQNALPVQQDVSPVRAHQLNYVAGGRAPRRTTSDKESSRNWKGKTTR